ncbi:hypothetical protein [Burkholderia plantarii]|uniref:hypothetical protein n=1 Tax=Burkholderia plantarii TaxID=41899 RepID=UPI000B253471|nr:hypothetical protein [Burkholderia plantarii]
MVRMRRAGGTARIDRRGAPARPCPRPRTQRACAAGHAGDILVTAAAAREYVEVSVTGVGGLLKTPWQGSMDAADGRA